MYLYNNVLQCWQDLIMAHAVKRIMFCTADTKKHLFVFVAKNPETGPEGVYSHVFLTTKKEQVRNKVLKKTPVIKWGMGRVFACSIKILTFA